MALSFDGTAFVPSRANDNKGASGILSLPLECAVGCARASQPPRNRSNLARPVRHLQSEMTTLTELFTMPILQRATLSAVKSASWLLRLVVASFLISSACAEIDPAYQLIAHRGGVVEDRFPDNSASAIQAAVERGYWGIEIDIRETKDGVLVMRHDADLKLYYDDPRQLVSRNPGLWDGTPSG